MKYSKRAFLTWAIILVWLSLILGSVFIETANGVLKYGYKEGEQYPFLMETYSEIKTTEGTTKSSTSSSAIIKIKSIDENKDGYDLKIEVLIVGGPSFYYGEYYGSSLINKYTFEGNKLQSYSGPTGFNLLTSTDWNKREGEWENFVDEMDDQPGTTIKVDDSKNGVFTLEINLNVYDTESNAIDYDNDGDKDGYTGWEKVNVAYDQNGVLKSIVYEVYMEFNAQNSAKYMYKISIGSSLIPMDILMYVIVAAICFVATLILGYLIGKRKTERAPPPPPPKHIQEMPQVGTSDI